MVLVIAAIGLAKIERDIGIARKMRMISQTLIGMALMNTSRLHAHPLSLIPIAMIQKIGFGKII